VDADLANRSVLDASPRVTSEVKNILRQLVPVTSKAN